MKRRSGVWAARRLTALLLVAIAWHPFGQLGRKCAAQVPIAQQVFALQVFALQAVGTETSPPAGEPRDSQTLGPTEVDRSVDDTVPDEVAAKVEVVPANSDARIANRLQQIMEATGWFRGPEVSVEDGVVFLSGVADSEKQKEWAEKTAMRTSDVVAVVNRISLTKRPLFDWQPAVQSLATMFKDFLSKLPLYLVALLVIFVGYFLATTVSRAFRKHFANQESKLLRHVLASVAWVAVFLTAVFIALRISGLTSLASTLLGGTGLIGLALGFAFRDIAENFLSSLLMSIHAPFRVGDLIEVDGTTGFVRKVTPRATVLATFEGSQVQIPNATIYKGKIVNFTATPLRRQGFKIGIGYQDSASEAQDLIMRVIQEHPAVEQDPAPIVVVESLGTSTVNLNCLYWFNQREHSGAKVGSALIRGAKQELMDAGISLPDEARELVFPASVPIQILTRSESADRQEKSERVEESPETAGEGDLHSEDADVQRVMGEESGEDSIV